MLLRIIRRLFPVALIAVASCYGFYAPLDSHLAGRELQLSLTDSGSVMLAPRIGYQVDAVEGKLIADTAGFYALSVASTRRRDGLENGWRGERVEIPHSFVSTL